MTEDKVQKKLEDQPLAKEGKITPISRPVEEKEGDNPESLLNEAKKILEDHGGQQANIPVHSDYWNLMNRYRAAIGQKNR